MSKAYRAAVTGAGSGLGRGIALALGRRGGSVLVSDIDLDGAEETARRVREAGGRAYAMVCDVRSIEDVEAMADEAELRFGPTELLVNNAGVMLGGKVGEMRLEDWHWIVDINLWGTIHGCHVFVPRMKERRYGKILNVASIAALLAAPETAPYTATKAAIVGLSESLSAELGAHDIDVTILCPTAVRTNIFSAMRTDNPGQVKAAELALEMGGLRDPEEVAAFTLEAVDRGKLYVFPQLDGRMIWRLKRAAPAALTFLARLAVRRGWTDGIGREDEGARPRSRANVSPADDTEATNRAKI